MSNQKKLWNNAHLNGNIQRYSNNPTDFVISTISLLKPHSKILELGCGVGNDSVALAKAGHKITATDFSEIAINKNTRYFIDIPNLKFKLLDISSLQSNINDNDFDAIYARLSLHYFKDKTTKKIFDNIHQILKTNGLLFFMCKSTKDDLYGKGNKIENDMFENEGHVRHFFSPEYVKSCLGNKFKIIKLEEKTDILYGKNSSFIEVVAQKI